MILYLFLLGVYSVKLQAETFESLGPNKNELLTSSDLHQDEDLEWNDGSSVRLIESILDEISDKNEINIRTKRNDQFYEYSSEEDSYEDDSYEDDSYEDDSYSISVTSREEFYDDEERNSESPPNNRLADLQENDNDPLDRRFDPYGAHKLFNLPTNESMKVMKMSQKMAGIGNRILNRVALIEIQRGGSQLKSRTARVNFWNSTKLRQRTIKLMAKLDVRSNPTLRQNCPWFPKPLCDRHARYRNLDGSCNNLEHPNIGRMATPFRRIVPSSYKPGTLGSPRISVSGSPLPSARVLSNIFADEDQIRQQQAPKFQTTQILFILGQFIDHDLTDTPMFVGEDGEHSNTCCLPEGRKNEEECLPIHVPANDPDITTGCISFFRSLHSPPIKCTMESREQMNQISHWLDLSQIYSSNETVLNELRLFKNGFMKLDWLPQTPRGFVPHCGALPRNFIPGCPNTKLSVHICPGDRRGTDNHPLLGAHTLFLREHNRIAKELAQINPAHSDESIFQETRRIMIAQFQHIVYNEFLPIILGPTENLRSFHLLTNDQHSNWYFKSVDARISNAFAAAAFRFGHSLIPNKISVVKHGNEIPVRLTSQFFTQRQLIDNEVNVDNIILGSVVQQGLDFDQFFADAIRVNLFNNDEIDPMLDLVALNINRGRDHGLPGYTAYRQRCKSGTRRVVKNFNDLSDLIAHHNIQKLRSIYAHVDDIDLFVGGILEKKGPEDFLPPTFRCIISETFMKLRLGDRYFYDLNMRNTGFTLPQLREIRKSSLAKIFCDNHDLNVIQPNVLKQPDNFQNRFRSCNSIPGMNLNLFRFPTSRSRAAVINPIKSCKTELATNDHCPNGFHRVFNRCYFLLPNAMQFHQGQEACQKLNGCTQMYEERDLLVAIRVVNTFSRNHASRAWNGITGQFANLRYVSDHSPVTLNFFPSHSPEPSSRRVCVGTNLSQRSNVTWSPEHCNTHQLVICEYPRGK